MAAFNYRQLIRQVPPRTWQFYFTSRKIGLPDDHDWAMSASMLVPALIDATDALGDEQRKHIHSELRRVHALANRPGVDALRNIASPDAALHEDFPKFSSDAERSLWVMANWPELFSAAEAICGVNQRIGKRGWKRLQVPPADNLFRDTEDIRALELALAIAFTPRKSTPRACQIDSLDRHLDGGLQLGILIEDNAQRQLEFGGDNRTYWRDVRPPMGMDVVIYPGSGVIDILAPGGAKIQKAVLDQLGKHIFRKVLQPQSIKQPMFFLNRLRDGFDLFDDTQVDLGAHRIERIRLSQVKVRANRSPHCDYVIKPPGEKDAPDVLDCVKSHQVDHSLMGHGFNIVEAVVTLYFLPVDDGKASRVLHIELKQSGISNLRAMDEADAKLVEALLVAWGVMQPLPPEFTNPVATETPAEALS
jgi:hypothetical protein